MSTGTHIRVSWKIKREIEKNQQPGETMSDTLARLLRERRKLQEMALGKMLQSE